MIALKKMKLNNYVNIIIAFKCAETCNFRDGNLIIRINLRLVILNQYPTAYIYELKLFTHCPIYMK